MKNSINIEKLKEVILKLQFILTDKITEVGTRPNYLISVNELIQELSDIGLGIEEMDVKDKIRIDCLQHGTVWINKNHFTPKERKHINDYEVLISFQDLGHRGNFSLIAKITGLKDIRFEGGERIW